MKTFKSRADGTLRPDDRLSVAIGANVAEGA